MTRLEEALTRFDPISLEEMSGIRLMNRIDRKFVTTLPRLLRLLDMAQDDYYAQEIGGARNMRYSTTYFDTQDFDMFRVHQAGHCNRQKLRFRTYVSSQLQFMEVKTKNNHKRTKKKRIQVDDMDLGDPVKREFMATYLHYDADTLQPAISNAFDRITLVNKGKTERLTIDTGLTFHNLVTGNRLTLPEIVVIELKRDGLQYSPVLAMLRSLRIMPHGFSKYCMGSALTNDRLRVNRFKPKLNDIRKLQEI